MATAGLQTDYNESTSTDSALERASNVAIDRNAGRVRHGPDIANMQWSYDQARIPQTLQVDNESGREGPLTQKYKESTLSGMMPQVFERPTEPITTRHHTRLDRDLRETPAARAETSTDMEQGSVQLHYNDRQAMSTQSGSTNLNVENASTANIPLELRSRQRRRQSKRPIVAMTTNTSRSEAPQKRPKLTVRIPKESDEGEQQNSVDQNESGSERSSANASDDDNGPLLAPPNTRFRQILATNHPAIGASSLPSAGTYFLPPPSPGSILGVPSSYTPSGRLIQGMPGVPFLAGLARDETYNATISPSSFARDVLPSPTQFGSEIIFGSSNYTASHERIGALQSRSHLANTPVGLQTPVVISRSESDNDRITSRSLPQPTRSNRRSTFERS